MAAPVAPPSPPPPPGAGPPRPGPGPAAVAPLVVGLVVVVLVALGATGSGLLAPAGPSSAWVRVVGIGVAVVALVGLAGRLSPSLRAPSVVGAVALAAALAGGVGAVTWVASDVSFTVEGDERDDPDVPERDDPPPPPPAPGLVDVEEGVEVEQLDDGPGFVLDDGEVVDPGGPDDPPLAAGERAGIEIGGADGADPVLELVRGGEANPLGRSGGGLVDLRGTVLRLECDGDAVVVDDAGGLEEVALVQLGLAEVCDRPPEAAADDDGVSLPVGQLLLVALVAALVVLLVRYGPRAWRGAQRGAAADVAVGEGLAPLDAEAADAGLAGSIETMFEGDDVRRAIVAAYARLLDALAAAGAPRHRQEAPHEHLRRVLAPLGVRTEPLHELAELFVLARFSQHGVGETERTRALELLEGARTDLRPAVASAAPAASGTAAPGGER